jgi:hypothetical protein
LLSRILQWKEIKPVVLLTLGFIVSRIVFRIAGVVFYGEFVKRLWQLIDVELLKTSLLESLYYSHAQPPLFNLLSGIILKVFPFNYSLAFHFVFLIMGWINVLLIYFCLRKLKLNTVVSGIVAFVFMLLPSVVLYENLYSYTYVNLFLLTLSIYLLLKFSHEQNLTNWILFCTTLSLLVLLRSFYHLAWLIVLIGSASIFFRAAFSFKKLFVSALLPAAFVLIWLIKNWILFGAFTTSIWMGMNLARIMPPTTSIGQIGPFKPIHTYPLENSSSEFPSVKLLHEEYKTNSGFVNYYHIDYISLSNQFKRDVMVEIEANPFTYLAHVKDAYIIYFSPACHAPFIDGNYRHINRYSSVVNLDFSGYKKFKRDRFSPGDALPVFLLHFILLVGLIYCFRKSLFSENEKPAVCIMILMLAYAVIIGNFLEYGENNRFRFEHMTIFLLLFSKTAHVIWEKLSKRMIA